MGKDILIETFLSISKTLSFSKTAAQLGISQQAVSKNIARLEANLGFTLLNRNSHNVSLTLWGKQFLAVNTDYSAKIRDIREQYKASIDVVCLQILSQPEFELLKKLPSLYIAENDTNVRFKTEISSPDADAFDLMHNHTDMLITLDRFVPALEELCTLPIYSFESCLLVSKNHPLYHEGVDYREFRNEPFVAGTTLDNLFGAAINFVQKDIADYDLDPTYIIMQTNATDTDTIAAEKFVANGSGIIVGASSFQSYEEKNLAVVPTGKYNKIVAVWKKDSKKKYLKEVAMYIQDMYSKKYPATK